MRKERETNKQNDRRTDRQEREREIHVDRQTGQTDGERVKDRHRESVQLQVYQYSKKAMMTFSYPTCSYMY